METEEVPVFGEHNVFLEGVAEQATQSLEVVGTADTFCEPQFLRLGNWWYEGVEDCAGTVVAPLNDRFGKEGDDECEDSLDGYEDGAERDGDIFSRFEAA